MRALGGWAGPIAAGAAALIAAASLAQGQPDIAGQRRRLIEAKREAAAAAGRAEALARAAERERDAAARTRAEEAAAAARVRTAEADFSAGEARVALVARLLDDQRLRLAAEQRPVARLLGGLSSLARRPALASLAQPGSVDDLVHVRAVFGSVLPVIRARTAGLRTELARTRALQADAALAAAALGRSRAALEQQRGVLAEMEARHSGRATQLVRAGISESDRALALGEQARDLVDQIAASGGEQSTRESLAGLPGPTEPVGGAPGARAAYRLPITGGELTTGFGELSASGYRARGLTLRAAPGAPVIAPAGGRITYAARFRGEGEIVIIDHGAGWTSLVTGFGVVTVKPGDLVSAGAALGSTARGDSLVTVELRRRGRPVDLTALL